MPADRINLCMNVVAAKSSKIIPFSINCRNTQDRWSVRGLRIKRQLPSEDDTNVILVSGQRSQERSTIGVNLYLASVLAERCHMGVAVSVVPNLNPREYERLWRREKAVGSESGPFRVPAQGLESLAEESIPAHDQLHLSCTPEGFDVCDGPLKYYIRRFGNSFTSFELNFSPCGALLKHKKDSAVDPSPQQPQFEFPFVLQQSCTVALPSSYSLVVEQQEQAPTYVIELRDRHKSLQEDQIAERADQVMAALQNLLRA